VIVIGALSHDAGSSSSEMLPALSELPGHVVWRAHARVASAVEGVLPPSVDIHAYAALVALGDGVPRSQQQLAQTVSVSRTTIMRVAAELAGSGLVERVRNPADRRSYLLSRTPDGEVAARNWHRHVAALEKAVTSGLTERQREDLRMLLRRVVEPDLPSDTPLELRTSIAFLVTRLHIRMRNEFTEVLAPLRLDPPHAGLLAALVATGPISQSELARLFAVSGAHMVQLVDELEERGLVARRRLDTDRRTQVLDLQPGAEQCLARALELADELVTDEFAALTPAQVDRLLAHLRRLITTG
jgi:DNA-binding MarR family transcriptional regulator